MPEISDSLPDDKEAILDAILRNPRIPSPPTLALRIFQELGDEDCKVEEVTRLLAHDPGLSAKILRTMNSALHGQARAVTSVRQATVMLGSRRLRSLILGLALPIMQSGVDHDAGLQRFWMTSITGAVMAGELAQRCHWPAPEDELAAALLRDLGMILLHQTFPEQYDPLWVSADLGNIGADQQCAWEERQFGVHHAQVSAALLERWQLPMELVTPIRFHHHPEQTLDRVARMVESAFLLDFVTRLADMARVPGGGWRVTSGGWEVTESAAPLNRHPTAADMERILQTARLRYGLEKTGLEEFLALVRPKIEEFSNVLGVDIGACPDFDQLLATGCEELVRVTLESTAATLGEPGSRSQTALQPCAGASAGQEPHADSSVYSSSRILQYEVVEVIGRGAMGIVLKAFDPRLARTVAIKLLAPELLSSEAARQRFTHEARCAAALRHEHVVAIHTVDELDGVPFLVMEYVHGKSLAELLEQGRTFSIREIACIGRQTALGLAAAHEARLIHRDIKPDNILIEEDTMHVRLADFGLARALDGDFHISRPGILIGTPNYMSPEQVDGAVLGPASDLFSFASVLYTLCTGRLPFLAETMSGLLHAVAELEPTPIRYLNPEIPSDLARVIERLHAKKPSDRPATATMVAEWLQPWCI